MKHKDLVDSLFDETDKEKQPVKYEEKSDICSFCLGRGIVDLPGEPDIGWGHVEPCRFCNGGK